MVNLVILGTFNLGVV